jgi:hypothetical protein
MTILSLTLLKPDVRGSLGSLFGAFLTRTGLVQRNLSELFEPGLLLQVTGEIVLGLEVLHRHSFWLDAMPPLGQIPVQISETGRFRHNQISLSGRKVPGFDTVFSVFSELLERA